MAVEKLRIEEKIEKVEKFPWKDFIHLQPHGFKYMTPEQLEKLRDSLINNGLRTSFIAWRDKKTKMVYCLDGYHRTQIVFPQLIHDGYEIPAKLTTLFIECTKYRGG